MKRLSIAAALPGAVAVRVVARREMLQLVLALSVAASTLPAAAQTAAQPSAPPPPNIVVFLVDDMGWQDTSLPFLHDAAGKPVTTGLNQRYRTPHMEALAARVQVALDGGRVLRAGGRGVLVPDGGVYGRYRGYRRYRRYRMYRIRVRCREGL